MSKLKKILLMGVSYVLIAALAVGGTLAYLKDEDSAVNVMTLGNVSIRQNEQQRVEENGVFTSKLENFKQGKPLLPYTTREGGVDTLTVGKHTFDRGDSYNNYVDKIVSVTNTGKTDAFVRTLIAIPTGGDEWEPNPVAAADVWLHWNVIQPFLQYWHSSYTDSDAYKAVLVEINGKGYYVWEFTHKEILKPEETSFPTLLGCFMDNRVDHDEIGYYMDMNNNGVREENEKRIEDLEVGATAEIIVLSQAVQAAGFAGPQNALDTAFGDVTAENAAKWFGGVKIPEVVDKDNVKDALHEGKDVIFGDDIEMPAEDSNGYGKTGIKVYKGQTIDGADNTFKALEATDTWDSGIAAYGGTIKNLTVGKGFRGIFISHDNNNKDKCGLVTLENVVLDGTTYTISCDQGTKSGLKAINCTFNGWTSYAATLGDVEFINCNFGEGNGYSFMRPYAPTTFVDCDFEAGFEFDARAAVTFENCTFGGAPLTADNLATLVTGGIANATVK